MCNDFDVDGKCGHMTNDRTRPDGCGMVGYPNGEKRICELETDHIERGEDYHQSGGVRWIGYYRAAGAETEPSCETCTKYAGQMMPPHTASKRCESGRRNHCSCDICF